MKSVIKILIGLMMVASVIIGYIPEPELIVEFTCISNTIGGLLLIIDGILNFKGKSLPGVLYLTVSVGLLLVFWVCFISLTGLYHMNYKGAFFLMHGSNPVLFLLMYFIFCDDKPVNTWKHLAVSPVLVLGYLLFDFVLGKIRGQFVYGFATPEELKLWIAAIVGIIVYIILWLFGLVTYKINNLIHKKSTQKE